MLDPRKCRNLIVYGGSFDPPHRGHVELPSAVMRKIGADGVLYVPAAQPPHKPGRRLTDAGHRLAMLRLALDDRPDVAISTYELDRGDTTYTAQTLEHLGRELGPDVKLRLLIGADMAAMFDQWHLPDRVIELAEPVVMMRKPYDVDHLVATTADEAWRGRVIRVPEIDASSSEVRRRIAEFGYDDPYVTRALVPPVLRHIREFLLYRP